MQFTIPRIKYSYICYLILAIFLLIGFEIYKDYGISWDEETQIYTIGYETAEFIKSGDDQKFLRNPEIYHGPAFELFLYYLQQAFSKNELAEVIYFRHIISYLFYWLSAVFLFLLLRSKYPGNIIIVFGVLWYLLMPRIFADSFFNSKDVPLLALSTICLCGMDRFLKNSTILIGIILGMLFGFLIAIRITGIIFPMMTIFLAFLKYYALSDFSKLKLNLKTIASNFILITSTIIFTIAFWPVLWLGPITQFINAWNEMSLFHWIGDMRFMDSFIKSNRVPWYYNFVWIGITTPIHYLLLFILGISVVVYRFLTFKTDFIHKYLLEIGGIILFFVPILMIIYLDSVVYDAWRHIFFVFSSFILVTLAGLDYIIALLYNKLLIKRCFILVLLLLSGYTGYQMINMHPYQNIYFNKLSGVNDDTDRYKYELDYWGVSFKEALEKLSARIPNGDINLHVPIWPGQSNLQLLSEKNRNRFKLYELHEAEYFITSYRWCDREFDKFTKIDSIMVNGITINATFRLNN